MKRDRRPESRRGSALIDIYEASASVEAWPRALDTFRRLIDARGVTLWAEDRSNQAFAVNAFAGYDGPELMGYLQDWGHYDHEALGTISSQAPLATIVRDVDLWPDPRIQATRGDFLALLTLDVRQRCALTLNRDKGFSDLIGIQFAQRWETIDPDFAEGVAFCAPHFAKVLEIHRTFSLLRARYEAVFGALDRLRIGVCIAGPDGRILLSNEEADRIFSMADGLRLIGGRLETISDDTSRRLSSAINRAAVTAAGDDDFSGTCVPCRRPSGGTNLLVEICPLRDGTDEFDANLAGCLVLIIDPDHVEHLDASGLAQLAGLLDHERQLCDLIVAGHSTAEIAETKGRSPDTIKSQIRVVFKKVGVQSRSELIRRLIAITPPIDRP